MKSFLRVQLSKSGIKLQLLIVLLLVSLGGNLFGAAVTAVPSQLPKGANVNGGDGDQQFVQTLNITFADDGSGTWVAGNDIVVTLPSDIRIADIDGDFTYTDEISVSVTSAVAVTATVNAATIGTITLDLAAANVIVSGDILTLLFPITTAASPSASTADYILDYGTDDAETPDTVSVTFADSLTLVSYAANFAGGDESSDKGNVYPTLASAVTSALPDFITDQSTGVVDAIVNGGDDWDGATLDNDETTDEITYYLWAAQTSSLKRVDSQTGHRAILTTGYLADTPGGTATNEDDTFAATQLDGTLLAEGTWYFYVTSSVTADWVLGSSDSVNIKHYPVFNTSTGYGAGVDYDADGLFEAGLGNDDNVTAMYLDSGGSLNTTGSVASSGNKDNVRVYYNVEDVDDSADVQIYLATSAALTTSEITTSGSSPSLVVTGLTGATKINSTTLYDESDDPYYSYDIYTDASTYETAGSYYIYVVANDGKHQAVQIAENNAGTDFVLTVKHYPYLSFQDHYAGVKALNTATERYFFVNWGETIDGDKDADGDASILLYASDLNYAASGAPSTTTTLSADATNDPTHTVLITSISDTSDTRAANRYMWDIRNSALTAGTYYLYGVISEGDDDLIVQWSSDGGVVPGTPNNRSITLTHGSYFLARNPVEGEVASLGLGDTYIFRWKSFDMDATASDLTVGVFCVAANTVLDVDGSGAVEFDELTNACHWLTTSDDGTTVIAYASAPNYADSKYKLTVSTITDDISNAGSAPSGTYDIYYVYDDDSDSDDTWDIGSSTIVKADGTLYFSGAANLNSNYNFTLQPTQAVIEQGDTVTVNVYALDPGADPHTVATYINVPATYFTLIDQDASTAGTQPYAEVTTNFDGTVMINTATTASNVYQLDFLSYVQGGTGDAINSSAQVAYFQLIANQDAANYNLIDNSITFNTGGTRTTHMKDAGTGSMMGTSVPVEAANYQIAPRGRISGFVDLEAVAIDSGQTVSLYVCERGSYSSITDAEFLSDNGDSDASDGIQVTLGGNGSYTLVSVPKEKYDIVCEKSGHLSQRKTAQTVQPYSTTTVSFNNADKLLAGDCAGYDHDGLSTTLAIPDNQIGTADQNAIYTAFDTQSSDSSWNASCDFDGDGHVYVADLNYVTTNTGTSGEGILYKSGQRNLHEDVIVRLVQVAEEENSYTYDVILEKFSGLHAYAVELWINQAEWQVTEFIDRLAENFATLKIEQYQENSCTFASGILGRDWVQSSDVKLFTFTMEARVENITSGIKILSATVVDYRHQINTPHTFVNISDGNNTVPSEYSLDENYPNPFNPSTNIRFSLPEKGDIQLTVYDILGKEVRRLLSGDLESGRYNVIWDGLDNDGLPVSSGVYFYRLVAGDKFVHTKKMMFLK